MRLAADIQPGSVPRVLDLDEQFLVIERAPWHWLEWRTRLLAGIAEPRIARELGETLGRWQVATIAEPALVADFADRTAFHQLRVDPFHLTVLRRHSELAGPIEATVRQMLDRRTCLVHGDYTVGCEVQLSNGSRGEATVPSGASTGRHEARELRDNGERYGGSGVRRAVANAMGLLASAVRGLDATDQQAVDDALRRADGTADLSAAGANAVLAVSAAVAVAAADAMGQPLWRAVCSSEPLLPLPMVNIISGGAHAGRSIDVQDFLAVPLAARRFPEAIEWAWRVRAGTAEEMTARGLPTALIADEGGLSGALSSNRAALDLLVRGIERA